MPTVDPSNAYATQAIGAAVAAAAAVYLQAGIRIVTGVVTVANPYTGGLYIGGAVAGLAIGIVTMALGPQAP